MIVDVGCSPYADIERQSLSSSQVKRLMHGGLISPSFLTEFSPSASFLDVMMVVNPSAARFRPISSPMPLFEPVTIATVSFDHLTAEKLVRRLKLGRLNLINLRLDSRITPLRPDPLCKTGFSTAPDRSRGEITSIKVQSRGNAPQRPGTGSPPAPPPSSR